MKDEWGEFEPIDAKLTAVKGMSTVLDNAMLDAINALPEEDRPAMCDAVRDAITDAPKYRIVDGRAAMASE